MRCEDTNNRYTLTVTGVSSEWHSWSGISTPPTGHHSRKKDRSNTGSTSPFPVLTAILASSVLPFRLQHSRRSCLYHVIDILAHDRGDTVK